MKRNTTKGLKCERCGHPWAWHEHAHSPVPAAGQERCISEACACPGYVGYGPASLKPSGGRT